VKKTAVIARYGATQDVGVFSGNCEGLISQSYCVIKTDRGTELGRTLKVTEVEETEITGPARRLQ
jgi:hypothetical protein